MKQFSYSAAIKKIFVSLIIFIFLAGIKVHGISKKEDNPKKVFGYLVDWEYQAGNHQFIRYDYLTHLACFDFQFDSTGSIPESNYPYQWPWNDVISQCRINNVKLIMSVAEFDSNKIHSVLNDDVVRNKFILEVIRLIGENDFDGVNIDFEPLMNEDEGTPVIDFMRELSDSVHGAYTGSEVSFATPIVNWDNHWNFNDLAGACDYLFVMGYNFFGFWSGPGPTAPLTAQSWSRLNLTYSMNYDYKVAIQNHPEKLLLGLPYFGEHWTTKTLTTGDTNYTYVSYVPFRALESYSDSMTEQWNGTYNTSWYWWKDSTNVDEPYNQIWIDNKLSLGKKYDLVIQKGLGGVGIWSLGLDGAKSDYWELIDEKFLNPVSIESNDVVVTEYALEQNYPNPFNPTTKIVYAVPNAGIQHAASLLQLKVYDILGREIATLVNEYKPGGNYEVDFNGANLPSGVYFYTLVSGSFRDIKKMMLVK